MGTMITLGIERMELDWGKNNCFTDHSPLFQENDIKIIPYYYVDTSTEKRVTEMKIGYSRKLSLIRMRLDLLGYSIPEIKDMYTKLMDEHCRHYFSDGIAVSFENFFNAAKSVDISRVSTLDRESEYGVDNYDFGEYVSKCIFEDDEIKRAFSELSHPELDNAWNNPSNVYKYFLENLDPYIFLRIIADNPLNSEYEVQWRCTDVIEEGWVTEAEVFQPLDKRNKILIVTEGSTDSYILKKAINSLYPDICDFFDFVDMEDNYPFTGVGNLYNFCQGLTRIGIQNNIIVIFDNDTAGMEKYIQAVKLNSPKNLLITKLPNRDEFTHFETLGPQGKSIENINERAVSIECFLDFNVLDFEPCIRWTSYNQKLDQYQGELIRKDEYTRAYKKCDIIDPAFNSSKLRALVEYLIEQWIFSKSQ